MRARQGQRPLTQHVCPAIPDRRLTSGRLCQQPRTVCVSRSSPSPPNRTRGLSATQIKKKRKVIVCWPGVDLRLRVFACSASRLRLGCREVGPGEEGPPAAQLPEVPALFAPAARNPPADPAAHPR